MEGKDTLKYFYETTWRHIPEDTNLHEYAIGVFIPNLQV
jgi:hypothetical protein